MLRFPARLIEIEQFIDKGVLPDPVKKPIIDNEIDEVEQLKGILSKSVIVEDNEEGGLGRDMLAMAREYTDPRNRFLFGSTTQSIIFEDSCLGAIADSLRNEMDNNIKDLIKFIDGFRFHFHTGRSAIKGEMRQDYTEFGSSLLAFRGALEWREAGTKQLAEMNQKQSLVDKLKK